MPLCFLAGVPKDVDYDDIKSDLLKLPGVASVHSLCIWILTMNKNAIAVHIAISKYNVIGILMVDAFIILWLVSAYCGFYYVCSHLKCY